jgi:hypothetical protein
VTTDCAVCAEGYGNAIGYECVQCKPGFKAILYSVFSTVVAISVLLAYFLMTNLSGCADGEEACSICKRGCKSGGIMHSLWSKLAGLSWGKLRIPLVSYQIVTQYIDITGLPLPSIYRNFLSWADVLNLNLGWLLSVGCARRVDFYQQLLIITLSPIAASIVLTCSYCWVSSKLKRLIKPHTAAQLHVPLSERATVSTIAADSAMSVAAQGTTDHLTSVSANEPDDISESVSTANTVPKPSKEIEEEIEKLKTAQAKHYQVFLIMTFLIYSTVSTAVFQTFACDTIDEIADVKRSYLRADYSIQCDTAKHTGYRVYAGIMIAVYPVGIPWLYYRLLRRNKNEHKQAKQCTVQHEIAPILVARRCERLRAISAAVCGALTTLKMTLEQVTMCVCKQSAPQAAAAAAAQPPKSNIAVYSDSRDKDGNSHLKLTKFLWKSYKPTLYYWEVVECMRRLLLTGLVVFIVPGTSAQAAISCVMAVLSMVLVLCVQPHADLADAHIYTVGALITFLSMFLSLALKVNIRTETDFNQDAFAVVLVVMNVAMLLAAIVQIRLVMKRAFLQKESSSTSLVTDTVAATAPGCVDSVWPAVVRAVNAAGRALRCKSGCCPSCYCTGIETSTTAAATAAAIAADKKSADGSQSLLAPVNNV